MLPLRILSVVALLLVLGTALSASPITPESERSLVARLLAFGRNDATPVPTASSDGSLAARLENHRAELRRDVTLRKRAAHAAWRDAFGRAPTDAELRAESALPLTYAERLQRHLVHLGTDASAYHEVIRRAYALVVQREPYTEESEYWRPHGTLAFVALVACLEDWARRNQPGLMVTSGTPTIPARSRFVTVVPLSPEIAAEARALLPTAPSADSARGVAVGTERLRTAGNMNLALVGPP